MNVDMKICSACGEFHYAVEINCPHCRMLKLDNSSSTSSIKRRFGSTTLLLGLALTGCGDKTDDTSTDTASSEPTSEPTSEPSMEVDYGVPDTGEEEE
jgi:hypothetical protein